MAGDQIDRSLPAEQDRRGKRHAYAVGGRQHGRRDKVERRVCEQIGVVPVQRAHHGTQDRERPDAIQQDARREPLPQIGLGVFPDQSLEFRVDVNDRADQAAGREADDEQHRVFALCHVADDGVDSEHRGRQPHRRVKRVLIFLLDAFAQDAPEHAARQDRPCIYNRSKHFKRMSSLLS